MIAGLNLIRKLSKQLPQKTLFLLYNILIQTHLNYGVEIWSFAPQKNLKRLKIIQQKAIKILKRNNTNNTIKFKTIEILTQIKLCQLMHDIQSDTAPSFFKKQFQNTRSIHQHLTRGHNLNFHLSHTLAESKILKNATLL